MWLLLQGLYSVNFFMMGFYIPPAQTVAEGTTFAGILLLLASLVSEWPRYAEVSNETAARYFGWAALVNALAAAVFTVPMLVPSLEFPILIAEWPGIYLVIAYAFFIIFGVIGMLGWSVMYSFMPTFFSKEWVDRRSVILQLLLSEVGIYVASTFLFIAGFRGASLVHDGNAGYAVVGATMEIADLPSAVAIFVIIVSVFLGALNILRRSGPEH